MVFLFTFTNTFFICFKILVDSSEGEGPSTSAKARKRSAKVANLKDAYENEEGSGDEVLLDLSGWEGLQKGKTKTFCAKIGGDYEVRIQNEYYGKRYISIRQWICDKQGNEKPGKGITLHLAYLPKLLTSITEASKHCAKYNLD